MSEQETPSFAIEKLYIKDLSLEVPNAPEIFLERETANVSINLNTAAKRLGDDIYEVVLTITVTAKAGEKTVFLIELGQGGIFRIKNVPEESLEALLSIACPNILSPYAREVVSDAATRAGFSPVILQPVNFEALYASRNQHSQAETAVAEAGTETIQ